MGRLLVWEAAIRVVWIISMRNFLLNTRAIMGEFGLNIQVRTWLSRLELHEWVVYLPPLISRHRNVRKSGEVVRLRFYHLRFGM